MYQESGYVTVENGKLHYLKMGSGKRLLLAFHGYGNNAALFFPFVRYLEDDFTIISFDLPHHGKSDWLEEGLFQRTDLKNLADWFLSEADVETLSLLGYSMGGRVCLTLTELMPERIESVELIAPDGLVFNPLYYFVTKTVLGKKLFTRFLTEPGRYLRIIDWLRERKWVGPSRHRFARYYLGSESDRSFLLKVWPGMREMLPDRRRLRAAIKRFHIPVFIFMGAHDKIIPVPHAQRFKKDLASVQLFILDKGHGVFDAGTLPLMAECLIKGTC